MAVVTFLPLAASAWLCVVESRYSVVAGLIGSALCLVTVFCTAMIYASLKSVQAWHTPLTPLCYLLFALAGGCVAASFLAFCGAGMSSFFAPAAVILLAVGFSALIGMVFGFFPALRGARLDPIDALRHE